MSTISTTVTADELNARHAEVESDKLNLKAQVGTYVHKVAALGRKLIEKKEELGHGNWIPWVAANLDFHINTAVLYMRVARNSQRVVNLEDSSSLRHALALCEAEPEEIPSTEPANPFAANYVTEPSWVSRWSDRLLRKASKTNPDDWTDDMKADLAFHIKESVALARKVGATPDMANIATARMATRVEIQFTDNAESPPLDIEAETNSEN